MRSTREQLLVSDFPPLKRQGLTTLQVNLGYTCNLSCSHCHVNAGPHRTEQMALAIIEQVLDVLQAGNIGQLDLTGGAPEINPHFRYLVESAVALGVNVIDRCNLTILLEEGYDWLLPFLAEKGVAIVASLPCYTEANVAGQRGKGVFEQSITALQKLNGLGYGNGQEGGLCLDLVYNPGGAVLPPPQQQLENDYRRELLASYGIQFNNLFTLTNMPISRFGAVLLANGQFEQYMQLLKSNFSAANLDSLMCKTTVSVDWQGNLYDCDFNQMLALPMVLDTSQQLIAGSRTMHISDLLFLELEDMSICTAEHCYGCTAGQGSSCGGALS